MKLNYEHKPAKQTLKAKNSGFFGSNTIYPKLTINEPYDKYGLEARTMASIVIKKTNTGQYNPNPLNRQNLLIHPLGHLAQQTKKHNIIQKSEIKIGKRKFMEGDIKLNGKAKKDITKYGNLLPGPDQAHIAVTKNNKLAYEINYTKPDDPFRWNILKKLIDSAHIEIKAVDLTTQFNTKFTLRK